VFGEGLAWERRVLADEPAIVLGEGLRRAALGLTDGEGADALRGVLIDAVIDAIRDGRGGERIFEWPNGLRVCVSRERVSMEREACEKDGG
jgi:hypothetical protein